MGLITTTIELVNRWRLVQHRQEPADHYDIRRMEVTMLVDTGSYYMCINEQVCAGLKLSVVCRKDMQLADGQVKWFDVVGPLEVRFQNRVCITDAIVLPGDSECLLGAIAMEEMDVLVHPQRQELVVNPAHPDGAVHRLRL